MTFRAKLHQVKNEKLIAICDAEIVGKTFLHNGVKITIQERFYGDMEYSLDELLVELRSASSYNIMGARICKILVELDLVHPDTILWFGDDNHQVGHVIVVR